MNMYNMVNGFNPACVFILPMLGRKPEEYPRFRNCFVEDGNIAVYTRTGGSNKGKGYGEDSLYEDPNFIKTYDDDFDSSYGTYLFRVPAKWKEDFKKIIEGRLSEVSDEYCSLVGEIYPRLANDGVINKLFMRNKENE